MVADKQAIRSLQAPPDGWEWDPEVRERLAVARTTSPALHQPPSPVGPRDDAEATVNLPTLRPGIDPLPRACDHCGSGFLNTEEPLGEHRRGLVTCVTCGRQACWLAARPVAVRPPRQRAISPHVERVVVGAGVRRVLVVVFSPTLGCGRWCSALSGHDAVAHERYGRRVGLSEALGRPTGVIRTGPLVIDLEAGDVTLGERRLWLTPIEWRIFARLASSVGQICPQAEVVQAVWPDQHQDWWERSGAHSLRVNLARLRKKLGVAAPLLETVPGFGPRLRMEPPIVDEVPS